MKMISLSIDTPLEQVNEMVKNTLVGNLGILFTKVEKGRVEATMPVDHRTIQPAGILHGGATIALAETVSGLGSMLLIDVSTRDSRGIQLSTNHISSAREGEVLGIATIVHQGETTHIWNVDVFQGERLISSIRVTNMIIQRR
jgi:1,4-dihydroxy-2-naphthoyl-CoA hydrolase